MLPTTGAKIKSLFDQHKRQDNKHRNSLGLPQPWQRDWQLDYSTSNNFLNICEDAISVCASTNKCIGKNLSTIISDCAKRRPNTLRKAKEKLGQGGFSNVAYEFIHDKHIDFCCL